MSFNLKFHSDKVKRIKVKINGVLYLSLTAAANKFNTTTDTIKKYDGKTYKGLAIEIVKDEKR